MRFTKILASMLVILLCLVPAPSKAHPHAWIDVTVKILLDDDGRVRGLHQTWLFDDFYSMFVMEGALEIGGGKVSQPALESLLAENMKNLAEYNYFTEISSGENVLSMLPPINATTQVIDNRLEMAFEIPLADPVSADDIPLKYAIYDPTYYIEMVHVESDNAVTFNQSNTSCAANIMQPQPDPEKLLYANSLDQSEQGYNGLGKFFAEAVTVTCG
ncbi:DUF1007 family protein [Rhodospirillales bacterium]|nr:DUF1007 family protein [Rhodospirillales bacterium]